MPNNKSNNSVEFNGKYWQMNSESSNERENCLSSPEAELIQPNPDLASENSTNHLGIT